jgi:hypothetical protein
MGVTEAPTPGHTVPDGVVSRRTVTTPQCYRDPSTGHAKSGHASVHPKSAPALKITTAEAHPCLGSHVSRSSDITAAAVPCRASGEGRKHHARPGRGCQDNRSYQCRCLSPALNGNANVREGECGMISREVTSPAVTPANMEVHRLPGRTTASTNMRGRQELERCRR